MNKKDLGVLGENYATNYLKNNKFNILERNFRFSRFGEIDIIASENDYICFIEVKTRSGKLFGMPSESVNINKQKKIKMLAQIYLKGKGMLNRNVRFDVMEVFLEYTNKSYSNDNIGSNADSYIRVKEINLIRNAF